MKSYAELQERVRSLIVRFGVDAAPLICAEVSDWKRDADAVTKRLVRTAKKEMPRTTEEESQ